MQLRNNILSILCVISLIACTHEDIDLTNKTEPVIVGFTAGKTIDTRTSITEDGKSTAWDVDDNISLWALNEDTQVYTLSNQSFKLYFRYPLSLGYFTTTLASAMEKGVYTYYATYPNPISVNGSTATFSLPATQNGLMSDGAAIMVAEPQTSKAALGVITDSTQNDEVLNNGLHLKMKHMMHALKFYVPSTKWGFDDGEKIERIMFTMPQTIAGDVTLNYTEPDFAPTITNGVNTIALNLEQPIGASSSAANLDFATASIIPHTRSFIDSEQLEVEVYTQTQAAIYQVSLSGRNGMYAGHITPVSINCSNVVNRHAIRLTWEGNNLGEDVNTIYFYDASGAEIYRITDVATFVSTGIHDIDYTFNENKEAILSSIAGQTLTVKYESEHAIVSNTIVMPETLATEVKCHEVGITVPYLFFEDFTSIHTNFEFNDERVASLMSADGHLLNDYISVSGWNGAHIKGVAGQSVRVNVRHQSTMGVTRSNGRLDTPAISTLKNGASVSLKVMFDMGAYVNSGYDSTNDVFLIAGTHTNSESSALDGVVDTKAFGNVDDDATRVSGVFDKVALKTGSIPNSYTNDSFGSAFPSYSFTVDGCGSTTRLCWVPCCSQGTIIEAKNAHYYLYIDNIKVQIVSK